MESENKAAEGYAPCPTCRQYSHTIGKDAVSKALMHFESMIAQPGTLGHAFDEATRDAAQVLVAAIKAAHQRPQGEVAIPAAIAEQVLSMGKVEWGATAEYDEAGHLEHLAESLLMTREHFNLADVPVPMHGLYLEGTETVLCHTGTSPNSGANAQALAGAWNWLVDQCRAHPAPQPSCAMCETGHCGVHIAPEPAGELVKAIKRLQFNADFQRGYGSDWFSMARKDADLILAALRPDDAREENAKLREALGRIEVMSSDEQSRIWATNALEGAGAGLPADVIALVIAARDVWDTHGESRDALDVALEAFASRVPYDDEPQPLGDRP